VQVGIDAASPGYVPALGATLVRGRFFSDSDTATSPRVAIVNQTAARRLWGDEDPVDTSLLIDTRPAQIVGVIADVRRGGLEAGPAPAVYLPNVQSMQISINNVLVRTDGDPREVLPAVRAIMRELDGDQPLARIATLDDVIREATAPRRFNLQLVGLFAALALGLAILGIYGVISESIAQRIPEIGVRMALGAAPSDVVRMVLSHGRSLVGLGLILGVAGAYALKRAMASLVFGVPVTDPFAYGAGCACLLAVTLVACAIPAVRAARIDPVVALRNE
jgi:putative ABC transport system permease protein